MKIDIKDISRHVKWFYQRLTRGFDDRVTWNLDITVAEFMLPRFKHYRKYQNHIWYNPKYTDEEVFCQKRSEEDQEKFDQEAKEYTEYVLNEIEWFLEQAIKMKDGSDHDDYFIGNKIDQDLFTKYNKRFEEASILFGKNFRRLWT